MTNPIVLITGALAGIGRATALAFARQGASVVISGRREVDGEAFVRELRELGSEAEFIRADVCLENDVMHLIDTTVKRFGRLDVAVNSAGTEGVSGPVTDFSIENYAAVFDTNVRGMLISLKYELPVMIAKRSGVIINLSSIAGKVGFAGASIYTASKHAVEGLTKAIALEVVSSGVRVNAVAPGPVQTEMLERFTGSEQAKRSFLDSIPAKRAATTNEIAEAILFVASDKAQYMTGQSLVFDGGYTAQ